MAGIRDIRTLISTGLALLLLVSCSYAIRPEPAVTTLSIGYIDNRTHEPKLSDALREELARELASRGIRVAEGLDHEISGTIESLEVTPLAERAGNIVKFSVNIRGDFAIRKAADDTEISISAPLSYIIAFGSDVPLDDLYSMREEAVRRAVAELAVDLAEAAAMGR